MSGLEQKSSNKCCDGELRKYSFTSSALGGLPANLNVFLPSSALSGGGGKKVPVLYYLAGLTCTEDNGAQKGGFHAAAAEHQIAVVYPDTSPRGAGAAGEDEAYDFGTGAGFYIDATKEPYAKHYQMWTHVTKEIPDVLSKAGLNLDTSNASITGHSMGGHGALTIYLGSPAGTYKSVSAFAPICHPTACPWGKKAFGGYFANGLADGSKHDATELLTAAGGPSARNVDILIDSGTGDNFYKDGQLLPEDLAKAAMSAGYDDKQVQIRLQDGYDHSYYFISTYAPEHVAWHAKFLNK